jgi:ubiquinone/menaquinone biosynthesis C-methylase UbiE
MQRAGHAAFAELLGRWPGIKRLTIACGTGTPIVSALRRFQPGSGRRRSVCACSAGRQVLN